ncbi:SRP54 domain-containing protein [Meloidogyne graminicola]|uniref:SRP54 domain-containing protein n=1 Tax=Meloidogyne graminicola TaxID=189291 RepID=A0A8T0A3P6_9BILA|nr:SRP54 domain-containing protein [Meloidogyne graminicola]
MIQLFTIFGKGGFVLWCFNEGQDVLNSTVNEFIQSVIVQQCNVNNYTRGGQTIKFKMDNEFDLILLIVYQSVVQLAYADKLLSEVHLRFRDLYKNVLSNTNLYLMEGPKLFTSFTSEYLSILNDVKTSQLNVEVKKPRTFQETEKSKKTVASLIETTKDSKPQKRDKKAEQKKVLNESLSVNGLSKEVDSVQNKVADDEEILKNKTAFLQKMKGKGEANKENINDNNAGKKRGKKERKWDLTGTQKDAQFLDYSAVDDTKGGENNTNGNVETSKIYDENKKFIGKLQGDLPGLDEINAFEKDVGAPKNTKLASSQGWFSAFKSLVGNKQLTAEDIKPALEKMNEILITKNVATEPAQKICESVGVKLEGKVVGTFNRITTIVQEAVKETLVQLLTPKRRVNILRDIVDAKAENRPYVIVFCGVNGVGKSTNLAKITFWLNENGHRVLIAAGDTFRAGAVEQLRTHVHHLNALHPDSVTLFEQGYGKDPASIAQSAIHLAKDRNIEVVLVDTAGRMQDNEPLMRALSKLINVNTPDLVLFVGEALVGNEAVDQLTKFNQALADHSSVGEKARLIDGIVLTKFDTIDEKVGAAVSMTYITGQPIVFVGTGQTYHDLRNLNANAVVNSLLK